MSSEIVLQQHPSLNYRRDYYSMQWLALQKQWGFPLSLPHVDVTFCMGFCLINSH